MAELMPALFIGHGNPMNALLVNPYTQRWAAIGATRPRAILSVSAHWYIEDAAVTVTPRRGQSTTSVAFRTSYSQRLKG